MQNSLYLLCFLLFGELKSAKSLICTVLCAIQRDQKCKIAYIYCAFCNSESSKRGNCAVENYKKTDSLFLVVYEFCICFLRVFYMCFTCFSVFYSAGRL